MMILVLAFALAAGTMVGWFVVPWLSDTLLQRSYARDLAWWRDGCEAYRRFGDRCPGAVPAASPSGAEGALGVWLAEALREVTAGTLTAERAKDLADAGMGMDGPSPLCAEGEKRARYRFCPKIWHRFVLAAFGAGGTAGVCLLVFEAIKPFAGEEAFGFAPFVVDLCLSFSLILCFVAMAVATVCDLRARVIPLEACAAIAVSGIVFQAMACGLAAVGSGAFFAVAVVAACSLANRLYRIRSPADAVGGGDIRCMAALSLASGAGAFYGMAACYACASVFSVLGCLLHRLKTRDGVPMAPFLTVWLVCGTAAGIA